MLTVDLWQRIRHLDALGWSHRRIARELGLSRNTVAAATSAEAPPHYIRRSRAPSPLEPWRELLETGLRRGLTGARLLDELREAGYQGSRSTFYERLAKLIEAQKPPAAACRFETDPGEQAQFDWSPYTLRIAGQATQVYIYSLLFGYSRRVHWFPSRSEKQEAVFEGLEAGLRHFGGACRFLLVDNARVFVDRHRTGYLTGADVVFNANFLRLCGHYAVQPIAGTPRHPQGKGKVENPFGHLERRFLAGGEWREWQHLETALGAFERRWEQRVHGTTKVPPVERFAQEQGALLPLPATPFLHFKETFRQVSGDCLISYDGVRYSVPWPYAGKSVLVRPSQGREVVVYAPSGAQIARHLLLPSGSPPVLLPEHYAGLRRRHRATFHCLTTRYRERYGAAGATAEEFLQRLVARHRERPERALEQVLDLLSAVPAALAHAALGDAVEFNLCSPRFLAERLRQRSRGLSAAALEGRASPEAGWTPQLALPQLDVERPLTGYGRALDPAGEEPA